MLPQYKVLSIQWAQCIITLFHHLHVILTIRFASPRLEELTVKYAGLLTDADWRPSPDATAFDPSIIVHRKGLPTNNKNKMNTKIQTEDKSILSQIDLLSDIKAYIMQCMQE